MIRSYHVAGLRCGHCVEILERDLGRIFGVRRVAVRPAQFEVEVDFDPFRASEELLLAAMRDSGFHPRPPAAPPPRAAPRLPDAEESG
jgi:copper chaperone CopZ